MKHPEDLPKIDRKKRPRPDHGGGEGRIASCRKAMKRVLDAHGCHLEIINAFGGDIHIMVNEEEQEA